MQNRSIYRGAFMIRLASGFSRPVMVYAEANVVPTIPCVWLLTLTPINC